MSQLSQSQEDRNRISFSFQKFSHHLGPRGSRSIVWTHSGIRPDLTLTIENASTRYGLRSVLKVQGGTEILEEQDLSELVDMTNSFSQAAGVEPVQIVIKSPLLAMRYPKGNDRDRRIQIKFHGNDDFAKVVAIFRQLGLPLTDPSALAARPISAASAASSSTSGVFTPPLPPLNQPPLSSSRPSSAQDFQFKVPPRPGTASAQFHSPNNDMSAFPTSTNRPGNATSNFQTSNCGVSVFPSAVTRPSTASPHFQTSNNNIPTMSSSLTRPNSAASIYTSATNTRSVESMQPFQPLPPLYEAQVSRGQAPILHVPASSIYLSQLQKEQNQDSRRRSVLPDTSLYAGQMKARVNAYSEFDPSADPFFEQRKDPIKRSVSNFYENAPSQERSSAHASDVEGASSAPNENTYKAFGPPARGLAQHDMQGPAYTRTDTTSLDHADVWIPPRRELPFPEQKVVPVARPASAPVKPSVPPKKAAPKKAPAKKTSPVKETKLTMNIAEASASVMNPVKKRVAQRKSTKVGPVDEEPIGGPPTLRPSSASEHREDEVSPLAAKSAAARPPSASGLVSKTTAKKRPIHATPTPSQPATKRSKVVDQSTQTSIITLGTIKRSTTLLEPARGERPASRPADLLAMINSFPPTHEHSQRQPPLELQERPGWASGNDDTRFKILNEWIEDKLEDPNFLQLVSDMSRVWKRHGFDEALGA